MTERRSTENDFGIDVSLIEERLALTPTERWERHAKALSFVEELKNARRARGSSEDTGEPSS